jgi:hypothetical protein
MAGRPGGGGGGGGGGVRAQIRSPRRDPATSEIPGEERRGRPPRPAPHRLLSLPMARAIDRARKSLRDAESLYSKEMIED